MNYYHFLSAIVGYCLAAMFSANVAVVPALTVWGSLWTYMVLAFWWFIALFITWLIPLIIFGGGMMAILGVLAGFVGLAEWLEDRKQRR